MAKIKTDGYGNYIGDAKELDLILGALPPIAGAWYFVDPTSGDDDANDGLSPSGAFASLLAAYTACTSGAGDGICQFSRGTTAAGTTSYLSAALTWSKHGITVVGVSSGTRLYGRARIANTTTVQTLALLITVSGSNNRFENIHFGNFGSDAAALGCVKVTGNRNHFERCHFIGAGHATPAAVATAYDVEINAGQENTFEKCTFGTDTIIRAAANGNVRFDTDAWRTRFIDCEFLSYSATSGKGHILIADATGCDGWQVFKRCTFANWNENGINLVDACLIGTKPNSGQIAFDNCGFFGFTAVEGAGMSGCGYVANSAAVASGAGGLATSV